MEPDARPPSRGVIWSAELSPILGHEQGGQRPCLVVSADPFNHGPADLVVLLPLTTRGRGIPLHVRVDPPEGGLRQSSFIMCDQIRTVSRQRVISRWGSISTTTMGAVEYGLRRLLQL